ncbi:MAG: hypothetical protein ALECFALPRED_005765 [Alectoria fallacina]|uniref:Glutathione S-transferase n=1 Tax=Alectoria fallacina TaxID=1903189 RepID=A0A8H3FZK4_9LECA|nr:MAG: hypothetical protein ALECFALPRED_005765 [Alectoria fallacina]
MTNPQASPAHPNGEVVIGDMEHDGRVILYIIKADETSYINYIKPLILAAELDLPHVLSRMVPSLKDKDPVTGEEIIVFEGTACLQYLADRFDTEGVWTGKTAFEKGNVYAWTAYQTAGIGLHENTVKQWDILEERLSLPNQNYIALKDRPTLADLSYFPFAMPWMFKFLGVDIKGWPAIEN